MAERNGQVEPEIDEVFMWRGKTLKCVESTDGCRKCFFNRRFDKTKSDACMNHFCEASVRRDKKHVKFIRINKK